MKCPGARCSRQNGSHAPLDILLEGGSCDVLTLFPIHRFRFPLLPPCRRFPVFSRNLRRGGPTPLETIFLLMTMAVSLILDTVLATQLLASWLPVNFAK